MERDFRGLQIAIVYSDDDLIELYVRANNGLFAGEILTYAAPDGVRRFAAELQGFPASPSDVRDFAFGTFLPEIAGGAASLHFACSDLAGHALLSIRLQSDDDARAVATASFAFSFEPASLDRFVRELHSLETSMSIARLPAA